MPSISVKPYGPSVAVAANFYKAELQLLKTDYSDQLAHGLEDLKAITYDSGLEAMRGLLWGLQAEKQALLTEANDIASQLRNTLNSAIFTSSKPKNGYHALGLSYVPFDVYTAELHRGERVLTAAEARAYIAQPHPRALMCPHSTMWVSSKPQH